MPKKFAYFDLATPVGLPSQCCLELSGKRCEGRAVPFADWPQVKPTTPNGTLPMAEMPDGTRLSESGAIGRTIAGASGLLGRGGDYMVSEMLLGITSDFNQKAMQIAPTLLTVDSFDAAKKQAHSEGRGAVLEFVEAKYEKFLAPAGDRFTTSGLTLGEIDLFAKLYCHARGAFPEVIEGKLARFYRRMSEVPAIRRVTGGQSQFGELKQFLLPVPP